MKIINWMRGYKVIRVEDGKELYRSFSFFDCEQYIFAQNMMKRGRR